MRVELNLTCYLASLSSMSLRLDLNIASPPKSRPPVEELNSWVEEHFDYLYKYAFRFVRSEERAEDLVQETFLSATEAFSRFEGRSSPRTWLTSILRHKILDGFRKKNREEPIDFEALEQEPLSKLFDNNEHWHRETGPRQWGSAPDAALKQKQFFEVLEACLSKLPEKMRHIFLLRELEGCDREEICKELAIKSSNVGVVLHRARLALQYCLQTNWFETAIAGAKS